MYAQSESAGPHSLQVPLAAILQATPPVLYPIRHILMVLGWLISIPYIQSSMKLK